MNRLFHALGALALFVFVFAGMVTTASAATPKEKCDWIAKNFPQTTADVQSFGAALAGVEEDRITTVPLRCDPKSAKSVFQGFVVLGVLEGYPGDVTLSPSVNGAIDGSREECGFVYNGKTTVEGDFPEACDDTIRLHDGSVTGPRLTWYVWNDANPPGKDDTYDWQAAMNNGGKSTTTASTSSTSSDDTCMLGADMAKQMGWTVQDTQPEDITKYGGVRVDVAKDSTLPDGWAAKDGALDYVGGDLLTPGTYSIYPPGGACRDTLKVEK
ncbi:MAG: hypothetical protein KBC15_02535 [Candidatus Levybacteria bacterium]|nr:hypothetical protein [Candidatus Levybacteria bacterium]